MKNKKNQTIRREYRVFYFSKKYGHMSFVRKFRNLKEANTYVIKAHLDLVGIELEERGF